MATILPVTNCSLQILRGAFNAGTKQTGAPAPVGSPVGAFVKDMSDWLAARGIAAEYPIKILVDGSVDLRDGDQVTGYTSGGAAQPAILLVQHVNSAAAPGMGQTVAIKTAMAKAMVP